MEMYARSYCTENEHFLLEYEIRKYCKSNDIIIHYYRKIKTGHQPCWREWKVSGDRGKVLKLAEEFKDEIDNEWRKTRKEI